MAAKQPTREQFESKRSKVLNAFADLEQAVAAALGSAQAKGVANAPLGQKIEALREQSPSAAKHLPEEALDWLEVRNALVHSRLRILPDSEACAVYENAASKPRGYRHAIIMSIDEHTRLAAEAKRLAELIAKAA